MDSLSEQVINNYHSLKQIINDERSFTNYTLNFFSSSGRTQSSIVWGRYFSTHKNSSVIVSTIVYGVRVKSNVISKIDIVICETTHNLV